MRKIRPTLKALIVLAMVAALCVILAKVLTVPDQCRKAKQATDKSGGARNQLPIECQRDFPRYPPDLPAARQTAP